MSQYLLIDIGNTFLKWGRYDAPAGNGGGPALAHDHAIAFGRVLLDEIASLAHDWSRLPVPRRVVVSNVAGTAVLNPLLHALETWSDTPRIRMIVSRAEECGVRNGYLNPAALGCDRWAAMIGARAVIGPLPVLVTVCGTASTIDLLTADGEFLGGNILPGVGLMQRALHQNTATLPDSPGEYVDHPRQTVDAIHSGCMNAMAGAVERLYRIYHPSHPDLKCIISGGAGRALAPLLTTVQSSYYENLVLEGLYQIALSMRD